MHEISILAFTERGMALANRLGAALDAEVSRAGTDGVSLTAWTRERFSACRALVFVGAAGIAVRAVAPHLKSKTTDPAVVVVDELGQFAIPLVSGHLGGANELALRIAQALGATPVITTATDVNGVFAVDLWAKEQNLTVLQPEKIKRVSGKLLAGEPIAVSCPWEIAGAPPENVARGQAADVVVDVRAYAGGALQLVPRVLTLGVGCRKGISEAQLEAAFQTFCVERGVCPEAVCAAASIDVKQTEPGLLAFCRAHGWETSFFSAEALAAARGDFSASDFVRQTVGVDNVCERSACVRSGGRIFEKKYAAGGVTFALAITLPQLDWRWQPWERCM